MGSISGKIYFHRKINQVEHQPLGNGAEAVDISYVKRSVVMAMAKIQSEETTKKNKWNLICEDLGNGWENIILLFLAIHFISTTIVTMLIRYLKGK